MTAANRHKLRHQASVGRRGAKYALTLLAQTDKLLGMILLANTLINAAAATLTGIIALRVLEGNPWALEISTLCVTLALLVVSEITPKVICATYADHIAPTVSYVLKPLLRLLYPIIWFINLFVLRFLALLRLSPRRVSQNTLSPEELRLMLVDSAHFLPAQHANSLLNLFELNKIKVEDVMVPRVAIEFLDLNDSWDDLLTHLATRRQRRLPVCRGSLDNLQGVLLIRSLIADLQYGKKISEETLLEKLEAPYYIPQGTPVLAQIGFFRETRRRLGFIVDEYGEILGLITPEDIVEEIIGEFTTSIAPPEARLGWGEDGKVLVEGSRHLREINRALGLDLPLEGPKTLNGLILEHLQDIPESGMTIRVDNIAIEIMHTEDKSVKMAHLSRIEATSYDESSELSHEEHSSGKGDIDSGSATT